jgi:hypothetical protein
MDSPNECVLERRFLRSAGECLRRQRNGPAYAWAERSFCGGPRSIARNPGGQCVAEFRPRIVSNAHIRKYIQFRWDGRPITGVVDLINIRSL